jgi:hypothetical protein
MPRRTGRPWPTPQGRRCQSVAPTGKSPRPLRWSPGGHHMAVAPWLATTWLSPRPTGMTPYRPPRLPEPSVGVRLGRRDEIPVADHRSTRAPTEGDASGVEGPPRIPRPGVPHESVPTTPVPSLMSTPRSRSGRSTGYIEKSALPILSHLVGAHLLPSRNSPGITTRSFPEDIYECIVGATGRPHLVRAGGYRAPAPGVHQLEMPKEGRGVCPGLHIRITSTYGCGLNARVAWRISPGRGHPGCRGQARTVSGSSSSGSSRASGIG